MQLNLVFILSSIPWDEENCKVYHAKTVYEVFHVCITRATEEHVKDFQRQRRAIRVHYQSQKSSWCWNMNYSHIVEKIRTYFGIHWDNIFYPKRYRMRWYSEADEKEKWGWWEGKMRGQNVPLWLWFKIFKKKISAGKSLI